MEVEELFKELDAHGGEEIDLPKLIDRSVGNVINLTLFNKRFDMVSFWFLLGLNRPENGIVTNI